MTRPFIIRLLRVALQRVFAVAIEIVVVVAALALAGTAKPARAAAQAVCTASGWNVTHEHALYGTPAQSLAAGTDLAMSPVIRTDRLYALQLQPQPQVHFAMEPGKVMLSDGAYGGLVRFRVSQPGSYRVSLDIPFWIDVVADGKELPTKDFTGLHGCTTPRKIVEFVLPAGRELVLQFSGEAHAQVQVAISRAPAKAA